MEELVFLYKKKKMYINFAILLVAIVIVVASFMSVQEFNVVTMVVFIIVLIGIVTLVISKITTLKKMSYFIKCNKDGIYTIEAFTYCDWNKINSIELKRYMGYQTLFFQIDDIIKAKFKPIIKNGKQYYCLPLADCAGKPQDILEKLQNFKNN